MNKQAPQERILTIQRHPIALTSPVMTKEHFSEVSGLREGQIRGQMERGNLPTYYVGRLALINVALLIWRDLQLSISPLMTKEAFAGASGLRDRQVETQLVNGNLPSQYVGRLVLVDVAELTKRCLESLAEEIAYH